MEELLKLFDYQGKIAIVCKLSQLDLIANQRKVRQDGSTWFVNTNGLGKSVRYTYGISQSLSNLAEAGLSDEKGNYCYIRFQTPESYSYSGVDVLQESVELSAVFVLRCKNILPIMRLIVIPEFSKTRGIDLLLDEQSIISEELSKSDVRYDERMKFAKVNFSITTYLNICQDDFACENC
jgi:hypothetical protein